MKRPRYTPKLNTHQPKKQHLSNKPMVVLQTNAQNERYVSVIFNKNRKCMIIYRKSAP